MSMCLQKWPPKQMVQMYQKLFNAQKRTTGAVGHDVSLVKCKEEAERF